MASSVNNTRAILLGIAGACIAGLGWSSWSMAARVQAFHADHKRETYAFERITDRAFMYAGRSVSIQDDPSDAANPHVMIRYGDQSLRLRVTIPGHPQLPGLLPHEDWLRVFRMGLLTGRTIEQFTRDLGTPGLPDRLIIVTRTPRPGSDPVSWGQVWVKSFVFDFHELLPDGTIHSQRLKFPTNKVGQPPREGELRENTWQYQAALQMMPQAGRNGPMYKFTDDAISSVGWTLPVAALSGMGLVLALAFAAAPRRQVKTELTPPSIQ